MSCKSMEDERRLDLGFGRTNKNPFPLVEGEITMEGEILE